MANSFLLTVLTLTFAHLNQVQGQCGFVARSFNDPFIGRMDINAGTYCQARCHRAVRGITCCAPRSPSQMSLSFRISTPGGQKDQVVAWQQANSLVAPGQPNQPIVFLIHGFIENPVTSAWVGRARDAYLKRNASVVVVDWSRGNKVYTQAVANIRSVGAAVGQLILNWSAAGRARVVGGSLGGQAVAEAGRYVQQKGDGTPIASCHAIDPAGIGFTGCQQFELKRSDCQVVEVIHSTADLGMSTWSQFRYGTRTKSGHCDYWVNCGFKQNCRGTQICGHFRAFYVYLAQLEGRCNFEAQECPDCGRSQKCSAGSKTGGSMAPDSKCTPDMDVNLYIDSMDTAPYCPRN